MASPPSPGIPSAPAGSKPGSPVKADISQAALRDLLDRAAIHEVLVRYCRAADRCDEELLRSCYHLDALDWHGRFTGRAVDFASWVIEVQRTGTITTQHAVSNVFIELAGAVAWVESTFTAMHVRPAGEGFSVPFMDTFWGRYIDRFEKRDGAWAIASREVVHDWSERRACGPPMPHTDTYQEGRRDRDDASYKR